MRKGIKIKHDWGQTVTVVDGSGAVETIVNTIEDTGGMASAVDVWDYHRAAPAPAPRAFQPGDRVMIDAFPDRAIAGGPGWDAENMDYLLGRVVTLRAPYPFAPHRWWDIHEGGCFWDERWFIRQPNNGAPIPPQRPPEPVIDWFRTAAPPKPKFRPTVSGSLGCGMGLLTNFYETSPNSVLDLSDLTGYSNYIACLNGAQRRVWHDRMIAAGFKVLRDGVWNKVHASLITVYLYETTPERSPDNPEFSPKSVIYERSDGYRYALRDGDKPSAFGVHIDSAKEIPLDVYRAKSKGQP